MGTQMFMQAFYRRLWLEKMGRLPALLATRKEWIQRQRLGLKTSTDAMVYSPNVWAAFILSGQH